MQIYSIKGNNLRIGGKKVVGVFFFMKFCYFSHDLSLALLFFFFFFFHMTANFAKHYQYL